jgi:hypothetical protein
MTGRTTRSIHPDDLDRIAAASRARSEFAPASVAKVAEALTRVFASGRLTRVPRNPEHRDIVLGLLCRNLRRRIAYTEAEINAHLAGELASMKAEVDHVTCRRFLVDLGFLKRDRAGARYFLNTPRLEGALTPEALRDAGALLHGALGQRRSSTRTV